MELICVLAHSAFSMLNTHDKTNCHALMGGFFFKLFLFIFFYTKRQTMCPNVEYSCTQRRETSDTFDVYFGV